MIKERTVLLHGVPFELPEMYSYDFFNKLFTALSGNHTDNASIFENKLANLIVLAETFSTKETKQSIVAFKAYISVVAGTANIPTSRHHPDYKVYRAVVIHDMEQLIGCRELLLPMYECI